MPFSAIFVLLVVLLEVQIADCLDCYECSNLTKVTDCHNVVVCQANEDCSITSNGTGDNIRYSLGCRHKDQCPRFAQLTTVSSLTTVGRDLTTLPCDNCCADDGCNKRMCQQFPDGGWSSWTPWSSCDITCGNGTISRVRMCDNPVPAHGGLTCSGSKQENQQCTMSPCPVHGGWSSWTSLDRCTTSCGAGLQKKTRTCSNPPPSRFGDHCFGDNTEYQGCYERACSVQHVAFSVYQPSSTLNGSIPVSWHSSTNIGGDFNRATGKFTCSIKGLYTFSATVSAGSYATGHYVQCNVYHDNAQDHTISTLPYVIAHTGSVGTYPHSSATTQLELSVGDTVYLHCLSWSYVHTGYTHFSGALISL